MLLLVYYIKFLNVIWTLLLSLDQHLKGEADINTELLKTISQMIEK